MMYAMTDDNDTLTPAVRRALAAIGRRGGQIGGLSRSKAKVEAARKNASKARAARMGLESPTSEDNSTLVQVRNGHNDAVGGNLKRLRSEGVD